MRQARHSPSREWSRATHGGPGVELLEAAFDHHVYDRHSHDTFAAGVTLRGVQRFWCRGSTHDSRPGDVIVLDPGEVHDGRSGAAGGYISGSSIKVIFTVGSGLISASRPPSGAAQRYKTPERSASYRVCIWEHTCRRKHPIQVFERK